MRRRIVLSFAMVLAACVMVAAAAVPGSLEETGILNIPADSPAALIILVIVLFSFTSEDLTVIGTGVLVASGDISFAVGLTGCYLGLFIGDFGLWALGRLLGRRLLSWPLIRSNVNQKSLEKWGRILDTHIGEAVLLSRILPGTRLPTYVAAGILGRHAGKFVFWMMIAVGIWTPALLGLAIAVGRPLLGFFEGVLHGPYALVASLFILYVIVRLVGYESTDLGRQRLKADLKKIVAHEFWPFWFFYAPLVPWLVLMAIRYRPMSITCVNPGIRAGGGMVGESKTDILKGLEADEHVAPFALIEAVDDPDARVDRALDLIRDDERFGGFPVVLKPDVSENGMAVRVARDEEGVRRYFREVEADVELQAYHPGPVEVGILWARKIGRTGAEKVDDRPGEIFSITRKTFPVITGDGASTLEELIWHHPRYRCQAELFLKRFADKTDLVLGEGEQLKLGSAGNHVQGAKLSNGWDLHTPELADAFERICQSYRHSETDGRLDFGRFDVRAESEEDLRAGRGFLIIELNGALSESTEMYDPDRSVFWCYRVLYRQWLRVFQLGVARRKEGVAPMTMRGLARTASDHLRKKRRFGASD